MSLFSVGFRPFFLLAALWAAVAVPLWLAVYAHGYAPPGALPGVYWHAHEMIYGYGLAAVTGFLLTAIPNWTGRLPVSGARLAGLAVLWVVGRFAVFTQAPLIELAFPAALLAVVAREVAAARSFHNLPVVVVLSALLAGDVLVQLHALGVASTAALGNRIGIAVLLLLIALIGGRLIPSFTRNWLARMRPEQRPPSPHSRFDTACLAVVACALATWTAAPDAPAVYALQIAGGIALALRLARWRGLATLREPLLIVLHAGYAWLAAGLVLAGANGFFGWLPAGSPLHALTVGAIGTMTLAVMTRATLGHTGQPLTAGAGTTVIYALITLAAALRVLAPLSSQALHLTECAGAAWIAAFGLYLALYGPLLVRRAR